MTQITPSNVKTIPECLIYETIDNKQFFYKGYEQVVVNGVLSVGAGVGAEASLKVIWDNTNEDGDD
ncbi:hypothetical protein THIOM_004437, partial [Candidatus Thiomargarita nelsonii]